MINAVSMSVDIIVAVIFKAKDTSSLSPPSLFSYLKLSRVLFPCNAYAPGRWNRAGMLSYLLGVEKKTVFCISWGVQAQKVHSGSFFGIV